MAGFNLDFDSTHLPLLLPLVTADWHQRHEDVVSAIDDLRSPDAIDALIKATQNIPEYLEFDDSRALAVKAIWALSKIDSDAAKEALKRLSLTDDPIVANQAKNRLANG